MSQNCQPQTLAVETSLLWAMELIPCYLRQATILDSSYMRISSSHIKLILCSLSGQWPALICTFQLRCWCGGKGSVLLRQWKKTRGMAQSLVHLRHGCHLSSNSGFSTHGVGRGSQTQSKLGFIQATREHELDLICYMEFTTVDFAKDESILWAAASHWACELFRVVNREGSASEMTTQSQWTGSINSA